MSTRSAIIIEEANGTATGIYCHFDGYLDHHKPILLNHYKDEAKVRQLIALGDISTLGAEIGDKHDFDTVRIKGVVNAYGRDRGEEGVEATPGANWKLVSEQIGHNGYVYVFKISEGKWYVGIHGEQLVELESASEDDDE